MTDQDRTEVLAQLLQEAIANMQDSFAIYDATGLLVFCNDSFLRFNRYTEEECRPGVATYDDLGELDQQRTLDTRVPASFEYRVADLKLNGPQRITQSYEDRVYERSLSLTPSGGLISILTDMTVLYDARQQAHAASFAKTQFLASMSHELRTPLNAIVGFSQLVVRQVHGPHVSPKYAEYANDIYRSGQHLISVVDDILELSRVEAGEVQVCKTTFRLDKAIADASRMIDFDLVTNADRLSIQVPADITTLRTDQRLFQQVITNLLSNANKYTPPDGHIMVTAKPTDAGQAIVDVTDTGIGIAEADMQRVLLPFVQGEERADLAHTGTGLGLALSKSLMEALGGSLEIYSQLGKGTTIRLFFP